MLKQKLTRLERLLKDQAIDLFISGNLNHETRDDLLYWLTLTQFERGVFVWVRGKQPELYVTSFEVRMCRERFPEMDVHPLPTTYDTWLTDVVGVQRVAYRHSSVPHPLFDTLVQHYGDRVVPLKDEHTLWQTKLPAEAEKIRHAARIGDQIFAGVIKNWSKFRTEQDIANYIHYATSYLGYEPSFPAIVASGSHAADPHHQTASEPLQAGFCIIDMGVRAHGYCSDMTRTVYIGIPSQEERRHYEQLLGLQDSAIQLVYPGVTTADLDTFVRDGLGHELAALFIHSLGHGIGTQVHEYPTVSNRQMIPLEEGMVITIEPGVYRDGVYGIRIEDDVLVTKKGFEVLTKSPKLLCSLPEPKSLP